MKTLINFKLLTPFGKIIEFLVRFIEVNYGINTGILGEYTRYLDRYITLCEKWGDVQATSRFKEFYMIAVKISMGLPFDPLPFVKSNKLGIPRILSPFVPYLKSSNVWSKRICLTLLRVHSTVILPINYGGLDSITMPYNKDNSIIIKEFCDFIIKNITRRLDIVTTSFGGYYDASYSLVNGPNGPAVLNSHIDVLALKAEGLYDFVLELYKAQKHPLLESFKNMSGFEPTQKRKRTPISGRISFIPEKGGKTRIIALVDFWTQQGFKLLHNAMMLFVRKLEMDSTFSQNKGFQRAKTKSKGKQTFSFDLSSATDRFPIQPQVTLISQFFGEKIGNLWKKLLDRDFHIFLSAEETQRLDHIKRIHKNKYKTEYNPPKKVRWRVGQPLGAYSSWITFSICHHLLVQFCYFQTLSGKDRELFRLFDFKDYQILGDDIVIWNKAVAEMYIKVLDLMDIKINYTKSIISEDISVGEFCKRLFINGLEISPIPLSLLSACLDSAYNIPQLIEMLWERWRIPEFHAEPFVFDWFSIKNRELLKILTAFRHLVNGENSFPWCQSARVLTLLELRKHLTNLREVKSQSLPKRYTNPLTYLKLPLDSINDLVYAFKDAGVEVSETLLLDKYGEPSMGSHPLILGYLYSNFIEIYLKDERIQSDRPFDKQMWEDLKMKRTPALDLFFLKTRRRNIMLTGQIVAWFYFNKFLPRLMDGHIREVPLP